MNSRSSELSIQQQRQLCDICWRYEQSVAEGKEVTPEEFAKSAGDIAPEIVIAELSEIQKEIDRSANRGRSQYAIADKRYELLEEIARGGTAVVWRVFDHHLQRQTAVKCLLDSQDNQLMRTRLEREARLCGQLSHPGIVPIHELSAFADGRPFVSMKLIEGKTLLQLLDDTPAASLRKALHVFENVCEVMAYVHARGIIHRDLKPGNIMVGAFGEVQIMDWGWAKDLRAQEQNKRENKALMPPENASATSNVSDSAQRSVPAGIELTIDGAVIGTPSYMSPEQAQGNVALIDQQSDVFALGGILARILTGSPPYIAANQAQLLEKAQQGELDACRRRLHQVSQRKLAALALRCLSADKRLRPANAQAVVDALSAIKRKQRFQKASLIGVAITAVCIVAGYAVYSLDEMPRREPSGSMVSAATPLPSENPAPALTEPLPAAPLSQADRELKYSMFVTLINQERFFDAKKTAIELVQCDEGNGEYHFMLGEALFWLGELKPAQESLQKCKALCRPPKDDHIPIDDRLKRVDRSLVIAEQLKEKPIEGFFKLSIDELLEVARVCDVLNEIESAIACYQHAEEMEQNQVARAILVDQILIQFARKKLLFGSLSREQRNKIYQASCGWMRQQFEFLEHLKQIPDEPRVSIERLRNQLKYHERYGFIREGSTDETIDESIRTELAQIAEQIANLD